MKIDAYLRWKRIGQRSGDPLVDYSVTHKGLKGLLQTDQDPNKYVVVLAHYYGSC